MATVNPIHRLVAILRDGKISDKEASEVFRIAKSQSKGSQSLSFEDKDQFVKDTNKALSKLRSNVRLNAMLFSRGSSTDGGYTLRLNLKSGTSDTTCYALNSLVLYFKADGSLIKTENIPPTNVLDPFGSSPD